jgi:hypothetical protein
MLLPPLRELLKSKLEGSVKEEIEDAIYNLETV